MVKMRLSRAGAKKKPYYHVVIIDSRSKRDGKNIDILGSYNPMTEDNQIKLDEEKVLLWHRRGAQPSETVRSLIRKQGIKLTKQSD